MRRTTECIDGEIFFDGPDEDGDYTLSVTGKEGSVRVCLSEADVTTLQFNISHIMNTGKLLANRRTKRRT